MYQISAFLLAMPVDIMEIRKNTKMIVGSFMVGDWVAVDKLVTSVLNISIRMPAKK